MQRNTQQLLWINAALSRVLRAARKKVTAGIFFAKIV
jgi:hypothetical protein